MVLLGPGHYCFVVKIAVVIRPRLGNRGDRTVRLFLHIRLLQRLLIYLSIAIPRVAVSVLS